MLTIFNAQLCVLILRLFKYKQGFDSFFFTLVFDPKCTAKGSGLLFGVSGWGYVRLMLLCWSNRPQWFVTRTIYGRAFSHCRAAIFEGFERRRFCCLAWAWNLATFRHVWLRVKIVWTAAKVWNVFNGKHYRGRCNAWWAYRFSCRFTFRGAMVGTLWSRFFGFQRWHGCARCDVALVFGSILGEAARALVPHPDFTLYTSRSTLHTPHSTQKHYTRHAPYSTFTLFTPHSTRYTPLFKLHTRHYCTVHTPRFTLKFMLHTLHSPLHTLDHSSHSRPFFTLYTLNFTPPTCRKDVGVNPTVIGLPQ